MRSAGSAAIAWSASSYSRILGANDKVNLGLIGAGGRGVYVMGVFQRSGQVNVGAVCDVFADRTTALSSRPKTPRASTTTARCSS